MADYIQSPPNQPALPINPVVAEPVRGSNSGELLLGSFFGAPVAEKEPFLEATGLFDQWIWYSDPPLPPGGRPTTGQLWPPGPRSGGGEPAATLTVTPSVSSVDEGSVLTFTVASSIEEAGQQIVWTIEGIDSVDVSSGSLYGVGTTDANGEISVGITLSKDYAAEGVETATLSAGLLAGSGAADVQDTTAARTALLLFEGPDGGMAILDDARPEAVWTAVTAHIRTDIPLQGTSSLYAFGDGVYIQGDGSPLLALGAGDFTLRMRFRITGSAVEGYLIDYRTSQSGQTQYPYVWIYSSTDKVQFIGGGVTVTNNTVIVPHTNYDLCVERYNGMVSIALDGDFSNCTPAAISTEFFNQNLRPRIGEMGAGTAGFFGVIDAVEIIPGVAVYQHQNFTPPTTFPTSGVNVYPAPLETRPTFLLGTANFVYADNNRKVTSTASSEKSAYLASGKDSGKWYAEFLLDDTTYSSGDIFWGVASVPSGGTPGVSAGAVGCGIASGRTPSTYNHTDGTGGLNPGTLVILDKHRLSLAVDMDARKVWWALNGNWLSGGDPVAGTGPILYDWVTNYTFYAGVRTGSFTCSTSIPPQWLYIPDGFQVWTD